MGEGLREITELTATLIQFLGKQAQVIGSTHALAHRKMRLVEPTGARQAFNVPERAGSEGALASFKPVVVSVPVNHAVVAEEFAHCVTRVFSQTGSVAETKRTSGIMSKDASS